MKLPVSKKIRQQIKSKLKTTLSGPTIDGVYIPHYRDLEISKVKIRKSRGVIHITLWVEHPGLLIGIGGATIYTISRIMGNVRITAKQSKTWQ